jgi:two-component system OmpR family sensor kinase
VIDHGKGIPEEEREVVFRPFGQGSNARHVPTSVGLGLAISRLLAEAMGGELTYEHVEGVSVMDLTLPVFRTSD